VSFDGNVFVGSTAFWHILVQTKLAYNHTIYKEAAMLFWATKDKTFWV
jgi:hypothetical protein